VITLPLCTSYISSDLDCTLRKVSVGKCIKKLPDDKNCSLATCADVPAGTTKE